MSTIFRSASGCCVRFLRSFKSQRAFKSSGSSKAFAAQIPSTNNDLVDYLSNNVVYYRDDILVCSKPYGIPTRARLLDQYAYDMATIHEQSTAGLNPISIESALPMLSSALHINTDASKKLRIVKSIPQYVSGPVIMCCTDEAQKSVISAFIRNKSYKNLQYHALIMCTGVPDPTDSGGVEHFFIKREPLENCDVPFMHVIETDPKKITKSQLMKGRIWLGKIQYKVISHHERQYSLVDVAFSTFNRHAVQLFMMTRGAPLLGDIFYQPRVARLLDRFVPVSKKALSNAQQSQPYIPLDLLSGLRLSKKEFNALPIYFHVYQTDLIAPGGSKAKRKKLNRSESTVENGVPNLSMEQVLSLRSPLPEHFSALIQALGIDMERDLGATPLEDGDIRITV